MRIYYAVEKIFDNKNDMQFINEYMSGIKRAAQELKWELVNANPEDIDIIKNYYSKNNYFPTIILVGVNYHWVRELAKFYKKRDFRIIVALYRFSFVELDVSIVAPNYVDAINRVADYLLSCGRNRIALFGYNSYQLDDTSQRRAFLRFKSENKLQNYNIWHDTFTNENDITQCFEVFADNVSSYNAVICTSFFSAHYLMKKIRERGIRVPEDLYIVAIGNSSINKFLKEHITNISFDHYKIGRNITRLYNLITKNRDIENITSYVKGNFEIGDSTENTPYIDGAMGEDIGENEIFYFYEDDNIQELMELEYFFDNCSDVEKSILKALKQNMRSAQISEFLYITESTVRYHVKIMKQRLGVASRKQMLEKISKWIDM